MYPNTKSLLENEEGKQRDSVGSSGSSSSGGSDDSNTPLIKPNRKENLECFVNPVTKCAPRENVREKCDKEKETEKEKNKFWTQVILVFAVIDISLIIVVAVFFIPKRVQSQRQTVVQWDDDVCIPCKDVYLTDDDNIDNIYNFDVRQDGHLCCPGGEKNLINIVTKFAEKQFQQNRANNSELRFNGENDRSAHLREIDWVKSGGQNILHWKQASSFIGKNMTYKDGRIQVKTSGTCFIYAHLVFVNNQTQEDETFTHSIWLRNGENHEEKLLELFHSQCKVTSSVVPAAFTPTHQGALFELKAGDSIELRVQNIEKVDKKKNKHNFGISCFQ